MGQEFSPKFCLEAIGDGVNRESGRKISRLEPHCDSGN